MPAATSQSSTSRSFQVVDHGESRTDLASRTEVKYTLPHADVAKLRSLLAGRCQQQVHNLPVSHVHSVYFDDAKLSACYANLNGNGQRRKLRLRWYDTPQAPEQFFFEIKWRNNRVTGKHRFEVQASQPLHQWTYDEMSRELLRIAPADVAVDVVRYCDPIVVVQYRREHFVSDDAALRFTIDYDIRFYDQVGKRRLNTRFGKSLDGFVVLEGKTPIGREAELRRLISPFAPRTGRCSKYVHGCHALGHFRGDP